MTEAAIATDRLGTVGKMSDGRSFVRFERHLPYGVEQVWSAITTPEQLASWFPGFSLELKTGGSFQIWFDGDCEGPAHVSGTVTECDPPRTLQCGSMRWELTADGTGGCVLVFTDVLNFEGARSEDEIILSVLGGWHFYMDRLEEAVAGGPIHLERSEPDYSKYPH